VKALTLAVLLSALLLSVVTPAGAEATQRSRLEQAASDVIAATIEYRAALERVLTLYERELARRNDMTEVRKDLFNRGAMTRREFDAGQQALADAQKNVDETRRSIAEADSMLTEAQLAQALARLTPQSTARPPQGTIRYVPGSGPIIVTVTLNGRTTARLVLDTGADSSVVKPQLLRSAGVDLSRPAGRGTMSGVTGKVKVAYYPVNFEAAGHPARVPNVAAFDTFEDGFADGLLGRDFLDQFSVAMDPATGTVKLVPRQR
jgi:predicted aspartyl protease